MTGGDAPAPQAPGPGLLERAISYALGTLQAVTPALLSRPTPCGAWDLRRLLHHVNDSLAALHEGFDAGWVAIDAAGDGDPVADPARTFRERAYRLRDAFATADHDRTVTIGGCPLSASIMASVGAVEIAVHGWDISQASGRRQAIPYPLAVDLLEISPLVVTDATRYPLFAAPVVVSPSTSPSDRLVAFLGRDPRTPGTS